MVAEQLRAIGVEWHQIILEPEGRNIAPAIALAACCAIQSSEDAGLLVLPSDHLVNDEQAFKAVVEEAAEGATQGGLVTFGITPSRAETAMAILRPPTVTAVCKR